MGTGRSLPGGMWVKGSYFVRPIKTHDVARYMGISEQSVLRMVRLGKLPAKRAGGHYYYDPRKIAEICGIDASDPDAPR